MKYDSTYVFSLLEKKVVSITNLKFLFSISNSLLLFQSQTSSKKINLQDNDNLLEDLKAAREYLKTNFQLKCREVIQLKEELDHFQQIPEITRRKTPEETQISSIRVETQLATALSENSLLKKEITKLKIENSTFVSENERLDSRKMYWKSHLAQALLYISCLLNSKKCLKEKIAKLNMEYNQILKEKEESAVKDEEEISCLRSFVAYLQIKTRTLETGSERLEQEVREKTSLMNALENMIIHLKDREKEFFHEMDFCYRDLF